MKYRSIGLIFLAALVGGGVGVFSKLSLAEIPPLPFTLLRFVLAICTLLPFIFKLRRPQNFKKLVLVSLLATANVTLFVFGVERTTATSAQILYAAVPLIAVIFSYFFLKEALHARKLLGVLIGFIGIIVIILVPLFKQGKVSHGDLVGNLIILVAVCAFALYSVLSKQFQEEYSPFELTIFFILTTLAVQILLVPVSFAGGQTWWSHLSAQALWGLAYVGILGTGLYYLVYQHAIKGTTPVVASMILYLQPISAFLWASVLLGERLTLELVIGGVFTLIGVALVTSSGKYEK
jgi:drug/metabolite transporter (DMT)-like permease